MAKHKFPVQIFMVAALFELGLLIYSQAVAYWGDESLHLLAGQLIIASKRPYLDFFYQHTPLFAYLVAGLMRAFGETWRVVHVVSALLSGGCLLLTGLYIHARVKDGELRVKAAAIAALFIGVNSYVISFGTVALPYGFCLFFMTAAFVVVVASADRPGSAFAFWSGLLAAAAPAAYLLTAPVLPILLVWLILNNRKGRRLRKSGAYLLGAAIPFFPLLWLLLHSPHQVWFDLVQYHLFHRAGNDLDVWFNLREIAGWFISIQGLVLVAMALVGLSPIKWKDKLDERHKFDERLSSELRLAIWLVLALSLIISIAHPTSSFYFVLLTPFLAMPAAIGICTISLRGNVRFRSVTILLISILYVAGLSSQRYVWQRQGSYADHRVVADIARAVGEVTPATGMIYTFEAVYFEAHLLPPPGLENRFNPVSSADEWLNTGRFDTVCIGATNPRIRTFKLLEQYAERQTVSMDGQMFYILWDRRTPSDPGR